MVRTREGNVIPEVWTTPIWVKYDFKVRNAQTLWVEQPIMTCTPWGEVFALIIKVKLVVTMFVNVAPPWIGSIPCADNGL